METIALVLSLSRTLLKIDLKMGCLAANIHITLIFQNVKKEQMALYDQVKCITSDPFPIPEILSKIQSLG